jgi:hypothetical protein
MYPYDISLLYMRGYLLGKKTIDSLVGYVSCVVGMNQIAKLVQCRP